ncbi:pyridoxal phosphate-dependent aminotransferase [Listeria fleischmannii]|uniref:Pyridoxal phosphate-dependent aminotransferase n=1 Tax=Listeria fleischmannii TaxID=1069827 RepID=A0A841YHK6_9LIST|nr:pyridoxal phosphate-dependent aminotransferase [Listeria fleischmannii]EIA18840.1 transaminase [Listeria fleischmannii subsp. coloradonensis]MBC1399746.1 pyridoxal phosphate-dependent aminotransferase [Listeria fleischmannii]MBC1428099.1 pyridoxal phosphate-dependent aminotransferase [Listeria fleischmannii]STY36104.1 LL-diaminopimelate aminotransferase [Listeria fleischmannii subsp. coloradonensis]
MRFSKKLENLPEQFFSKLVQNVNRKVAEGHDVINLGQGNPDQPTPQNIVDALKNAADNAQNHKYSLFRGKVELKEAAAHFYKKEYGVDLDPEKEIAILFGTKTGLVELPMCLLNPQETMLLPDPGYPDYLSGAVLADAKYKLMPLLEENQFLPDYAQIDAATRSDAKLMYLNYPNNPTGATATKQFFEDTVSFAQKNEIAVVHDFAYGAIGFSEKPISFLETEGAKEVGIELYTLSKTYNMAGWRIGFAAGNEKMIEAINLIQDHLYVSLFPAIQDAGIEALLGSQQAVYEQNERYENRKNAFLAACEKIGWEAVVPKGSFFAWMKVPQNFTSTSFTELLLEKANVAVADGSGFGEYGEGYVRVGLLMDEDRLVEAVMRIETLNIFKTATYSR